MIAFLAVAALMMAGALLAVLPPLLARRATETSGRAAANIALLRKALEDNDAELSAGAIDRVQWEKTRGEIERRVLEEGLEEDAAPQETASAASSPWLASLFGFLLPVAAISLYIALGEPRAISGSPELAEESAPHAVQRDQIEEMVKRLAAKLEASPEDAEGWATLGRSYAYLGRFPDAMSAYEQAMKRRPEDARLLADYADMYATTKGGGSLMGEPEKLIKRALALDPHQPKALALAGTIAFQKEDFAGAVRHWERAVAVIPEDSPFARQIASGLAEAREAAARAPGAAPAKVASAKAEPAKAEPAKAAAGASVSGTVTIAPALARSASAEDTLFVFAHGPEGGGPPLAVLRARVRDLPLKFKLDDSMSMSPQFKLSNAARVVVTARVSKSGTAVPQPGDMEGVSAPVALGAAGVAVNIDRARGG